MLDAIRRKCLSYYHQIPSNTFQAAGKSALYSFTVVLIYIPKDSDEVDLICPLISASNAAMASLIYSLATPLFNVIFGDNSIHLDRELIKGVITVISTSIVLNYFTTGKVHFSAINKIPMLPMHVGSSLFDLIPSLCDKLRLNDLANCHREVYQDLGIQVAPGSGSVFLAFGPKAIH